MIERRMLSMTEERRSQEETLELVEGVDKKEEKRERKRLAITAVFVFLGNERESEGTNSIRIPPPTLKNECPGIHDPCPVRQHCNRQPQTQVLRSEKGTHAVRNTLISTHQPHLNLNLILFPTPVNEQRKDWTEIGPGTTEIRD